MEIHNHCRKLITFGGINHTYYMETNNQEQDFTASKNPEIVEKEKDATLENSPAAEQEAPKKKTFDNKNLRKPFPNIGDLLAVFGMLMGLQILVAVVVVLMGVFSHDAAAGEEIVTVAESPAHQGFVMAMTYLAAMLPTYLFALVYRYSRGGRGPVAEFSLSGFNPVMLLWAFGFMLAVGVVCEPVFKYLPHPDLTAVGRGGWTIFSLVVCAPVLEELLCRGLILGSLRKRYGVAVAWFLSSLFFGLMHLQPLQVVNAFIIGLILGYVYIETRSIWSVIILHALNNALAYIMLMAGLSDRMLINLVNNHFWYICIYVMAAVFSVISGYMMWRSIRTMKNEKQIFESKS